MIPSVATIANISQAIAAGALGVVALLLLQESYAPQVLSKKLSKERARRPREGVYCVLDLKTNPAGPGFLLGQFVRPRIIHFLQYSAPIRSKTYSPVTVIYLVVDPALFLASFFYSVCFGIAYLVLVTVRLIPPSEFVMNWS